MRIRNAFEEIFCLRSDISNHDIILPKGQIRKRVWILEYRLDIFWSVIGSGFGEPGGIPPPGIPRRTPPPGEPTENHVPVSLLCAVCKVLERLNTIRSNNSNAHSNMAFYEIAPALHSCYLFLILLVKTKTKIFNQMLSHLHFAKTSIPLITQFFSKNTNDMVRRRGSRINTDQFPKQVLRGSGYAPPGIFSDFNFPGFLSYSDRILGSSISPRIVHLSNPFSGFH